MRPAYGYIRVSSDEQADSGLGLEAQRQRIRAYCEAKGLLLTMLFEDPAISGGKPLSSRPAGSRLLADARRHRAVVIVAKFDRLFRSVADAAQTIADFDRPVDNGRGGDSWHEHQSCVVGGRETDHRPEIIITTAEHEVNDQAVAAL